MTIWRVPAKVLNVIDGDTIKVEMDLGWGVFKRDSVRVLGINSPELRVKIDALWPEIEWPGLKALEAAKQFLDIGEQSVTIVSKQLDKYGRTLGDVILPDGTSLGILMMQAGWARPLKYTLDQRPAI